MKHTEGPWELIIDGENDPYIRESIRLYGDQDKPLIARDIPNEANARLIAAAPDMLAILEMIKGYNTGSLEYSMASILNKVNIIITKAKGE